MGPGGTGSGFDSSCVDYVIHVYLFLFIFILFFNLFYFFIRLMGESNGAVVIFSLLICIHFVRCENRKWCPA